MAKLMVGLRWVLPHVFAVIIILLLSVPSLAQVQISIKPEGKAPNLIVLVHGCCTDVIDVINDWDSLRSLIADRIIQNKTPGAWEIVSLDWTICTPDPSVPCTPKPALPPFFLEEHAKIAYTYADVEGPELANVINQYPIYEYIHLIAHSAGAKLIDKAAKWLSVLKNQKKAEKPFIHLTFLDAYTPDNSDTPTSDKNTYGFLPDYPNHYAEHYVDRTFVDWFVKTNELLPNAFNFDITGWDSTLEEKRDGGHQWPRYWYKKSITAPEPLFTYLKYGYPLSREGGNLQFINVMSQLYPPGGSITLETHLPAVGVPVITEVAFPTSITGDGQDVKGTVKFTALYKDVNGDQFDVLGDTCGQCGDPFGLEVSDQENNNGEFGFDMWCTSDNTGFFESRKVILRDKNDNESNPYIFYTNVNHHP